MTSGVIRLLSSCGLAGLKVTEMFWRTRIDKVAESLWALRIDKVAELLWDNRFHKVRIAVGSQIDKVNELLWTIRVENKVAEQSCSCCRMCHQP